MDANYNLGGLINRIKARLKDADYSDSDITQFINDAYFDILGEEHYQFLEKHYISFTQTGGIVLLPKDFQTTIHLTASDDHGMRRLEYIDSRRFFNAPKGSALKHYKYTVFANKLYYDVPNIDDGETQNDDEHFYTLDLHYLAKPLPLSDATDVPVIPYEFGEALLLGALSRAEQLRDNFDFAQIYDNKREDLLTNMKLRYCPRQLEGENRAKLPVFQRLRH